MYRRTGSIEDLTAALPRALRLLRERAGYASLRPAAQAIAEKTGHSISPATLSEWERGTMPVADSLICFLSGLGYDFRHLQATLEEVMAVQDDPAAQLAGRLRKDPALRQRLRTLIGATSADPDQPGDAVAGILDDLDRLDGTNGENGDEQDG